MNIPIKEFEQYIDETILKRGLDYFLSGAVTDFMELSHEEYEATVSGSDEYTVRVHIQNGVLMDHDCDCPYDMGPVCKHMVAVLFSLQKDELDLKELAPKKKKKEKTKSVQQQVLQVLKEISHDELKDFVVENCQKDKSFRNLFLATFGHVHQGQSKDFYQKQIRSILKTAAGRDQFIYWSDMKYVVNAIMPFLQNADSFFEKKNYVNVFYIATALLEEMNDAIEYIDDSSGEIGFFIRRSMELLEKIAQEDLSESLHREIFSYGLTAFDEKWFEGWDWHYEIFEVAILVAKDEKEADVLLHKLHDWSGEYASDYARKLTLDIMRRFKPQKEVDAFIQKNISVPDIRRQEIQLAFDIQNYERAKQLALDGIDYDRKDKPGLLSGWYDWLLKIALEEKDSDKVIEYARHRLLHEFMSTMDYYQILKDHVHPSNWKDFVEDIIGEANSMGVYGHTELIRRIFIKEELWDRLLTLLQKNPTFSTIRQNEEYLAGRYSKELLDLYQDAILNHLHENMGRNHYQTVCQYLRRMKKLGGKDQVVDLIATLRKKYGNRRALLQELAKV